MQNEFYCTLHSHQSGAVLLETAISLIIFAFILLFGVDLLRISYVSASIQSSIFQAGRAGIVAPALNRINVIEQTAQQRADALGVSINTSDILVCPENDLSCSTSEPGDVNQFIHIRLNHSVPMIVFGGHTINLKAEVLVRNEI